MYHLNDSFDSIDIWNCSNQAQFLNKEIIMKCLAIKFFAWTFLKLSIQKIGIASLLIVIIEKPEFVFLLML